MTTLDADCFYTCAKGNLTAKRSRELQICGDTKTNCTYIPTIIYFKTHRR